jgi:hypothetical protein
MPRIVVDEIFLSGIQVVLETGTGSELRGLKQFTPPLECDGTMYFGRSILAYHDYTSIGLLKTDSNSSQEPPCSGPGQ